jgi:cell fate regulator YaaT (PSP1 superfamily)
MVIVETAHGQALGRVIEPAREVPPESLQEPLKPVIRKATPEDLQKAAELQTAEREALKKCAELVAKHNLPMKLIEAEYSFDGGHLTVYFSAEGKVDFRALLKEMGATFKVRVELRQIGARDVAKLLGGVGRCGRPVCCATHLSKFAPISVRMARDQALPLNPTMISGACGKLLCCLKFEHEQYLALRGDLPPIGKKVHTPHGTAKILTVNYLKGIATVQLEEGGIAEMKVSDLKPLKANSKTDDADG